LAEITWLCSSVQTNAVSLLANVGLPLEIRHLGVTLSQMDLQLAAKPISGTAQTSDSLRRTRKITTGRSQQRRSKPALVQVEKYCHFC